MYSMRGIRFESMHSSRCSHIRCDSMSLIRVEVFNSIRCVRVKFWIPGGHFGPSGGALPEAILGLPGALLVLIWPKWAKSLARVLQEGSGRALGGFLGLLGAKKSCRKSPLIVLEVQADPVLRKKSPEEPPKRAPKRLLNRNTPKSQNRVWPEHDSGPRRGVQDRRKYA